MSEQDWALFRIIELLARIQASDEDKVTLYRMWQSACRPSLRDTWGR